MKIKSFIRRKLKKYVKKLYHWIMQTGNGGTSEKKSIYVNDVKFNYSIDEKLSWKDKQIMVSQMFYYKNGYYPNLFEPKTFSEKVLWMKLFYKDDRITICSDKFNGKRYIADVVGKEYVVPVLKKYENVYDIDLNDLPEQFVLKVNWCTGYNIIVSNKERVNIDEVRAKLDFWQLPWKSSYYGSFNWGYKNMKPIIFAEEYLDLSHNTTEYKLFCFNGKVNFFLVEMDYFGKNPERAYYDRNWSELPFSIEKIKKAHNVMKPNTYDEMIQVAESLAEPFPLVRVDFYDISGKLYVGELTFYSGGGFSKIYPEEWDEKLGEQLDIRSAQEKMRNQKEDKV